MTLYFGPVSGSIQATIQPKAGVMVLALVGGFWFITYALCNLAMTAMVLGGYVSSAANLLDLIVHQLIFSALLGKFSKVVRSRYHLVTKNSACADDARDIVNITKQPQWTQLVPIVACHLMGTIMTDMSYLMMSATVTTLLKSAEPIFTVVLSILLLKKQYGVTTVAAVFCMVIGIATCVFQSQSVNLTGVVYASISNAAFPLRNVLTKKIQVDTQQAPWEVFTSLSAMGACVVGIVWMGKVALMGVSTQPMTLAASFLFGSYQIFSFGFLGRTSALTHAICNVFKRVVTMTLSVWFFGDVLGVEFYVGISIAFAGLTLYTLVGKGLVSDPSLIWRGLAWNVLVLLLLSVFAEWQFRLLSSSSGANRFSLPFHSVDVSQRSPDLYTVRENSLDLHRTCLDDIQRHTRSLFQPYLKDVETVLLVDPSYQPNIGDNLLVYGELSLLYSTNTTYVACGIRQSEGLELPCHDATYESTEVSLWQGGGNWGDIWSVQQYRIKSFKSMKKTGAHVISMPQSLHYHNVQLQSNDAHIINELVEKGLNLSLSWRQEDSYDKAKSLYPTSHHILSPDIAFMIGPIANTRIYTNQYIPEVDLLFLLRKDKESIFGSHNQLRSTLKKELKNTNISWVLVDWADRKRFYNATVRLPPPMQQVPHSNVFDFNARFASGVSMYATASVIVTDRLHGSILALLMNKQHVYLDQINQKLTRTREVAFRVSESCRRLEGVTYLGATNLTDSVEKALRLLQDAHV